MWSDGASLFFLGVTAWAQPKIPRLPDLWKRSPQPGRLHLLPQVSPNGNVAVYCHASGPAGPGAGPVAGVSLWTPGFGGACIRVECNPFPTGPGSGGQPLL